MEKGIKISNTKIACMVQYIHTHTLIHSLIHKRFLFTQFHSLSHTHTYTHLVGSKAGQSRLEYLCRLCQSLEVGLLVGHHLGGGNLISLLNGLREHGHPDPVWTTLKHVVIGG